MIPTLAPPESSPTLASRIQSDAVPPCPVLYPNATSEWKSGVTTSWLSFTKAVNADGSGGLSFRSAPSRAKDCRSDRGQRFFRIQDAAPGAITLTALAGEVGMDRDESFDVPAP